MGKKPKQHTESTADREKAIEATYFAHNCGLSKDEAVKMLREDPIRIDDESQESSGRRTEAILDCSSQPRPMIFFTSDCISTTRAFCVLKRHPFSSLAEHDRALVPVGTRLFAHATSLSPRRLREGGGGGRVFLAVVAPPHQL